MEAALWVAGHPTMSDINPTKAPSGGHLVRQIGLGSGIAVVVGSTIGSGIFKSPSGIAEQLPGPLPMLAIWIVGGFFVLCGALTLGEIGGAFPYSGGLYVYVREAYGRLAAFLFGWAQLILLRPSSVGAVAIVFGQYFLRLVGMKEGQAGYDQWTAVFSIGAIAVGTVANVMGVRFGTAIQNLTTIAKTAGLLVLIGLALCLGLPSAGAHFTPAVPAGSFSVPMFGLALVAVLWAYDGWADGSYINGEILDPKRNVPRAILFGTVIVIIVYFLANLAYLSVFSVKEIGKSQIIAADSMSKLVGVGGVTFIVATVMISTFGTLSASILTSPRIFFAMAEDRLFFSQIAQVHPKFKTPHVSVILTGILGSLYVLAATAMSGSKAFGALTDAFVIGVVPFYALSVGSVFIFRRRERARQANVSALPANLDDSLVDQIRPGHTEIHPHAYSPSVRTPFFPVTPILFIASTLFLLGNSLIDADSRIPTLITLGILVAGAPIYAIAFSRKSTS
ncbi:MAG: amino acid permease [Fimbriimonas sp.]|nr:amino acid permease [Fimbriimonas sp.]